MGTGLPVAVYAVFLLAGLAALAWSSDLFVDGSAALAKILGISPFIVGMVVIGFGTSAPELCVSVLSGLSGHTDLSVGNAYGSCIFNVAVIVGVAALIFPVVVRPTVAFVAAPVLALISLFSMWLLGDGTCSRGDAALLLCLFAVVLPLYCWLDSRTGGAASSDEEKSGATPALRVAVAKTVFGLAILIGSSYILVEGAVGIAKYFGVSDLMIGLTVVAVGTSLPELASAVAAARRRQHEFVFGNIVGSNLFNMLAVVGLACAVSPASPSPYVLSRDLPMTTAVSLAILVLGANWRSPKQAGVFGRGKAIVLLATFVAYAAIMFIQETGGGR